MGPGPPFSPEIYHKMLEKLKMWDPKYGNSLLFWRGGGLPLPPFLEHPPPHFEISGSATVNLMNNTSWDTHLKCSFISATLDCNFININPLMIRVRTGHQLRKATIWDKSSDEIAKICAGPWPCHSMCGTINANRAVKRPRFCDGPLVIRVKSSWTISN
jgi:hypothetical protein